MATRFLTGPDGFGHTVGKPGIEDFAEQLREQRRFRLEQLHELDSTEADAAPALLEVTDTLRRAARSALAEVDAALARIDEGSYGRCTNCDQPILTDRLEIVPMAALCMRCQRAREQS